MKLSGSHASFLCEQTIDYLVRTYLIAPGSTVTSAAAVISVKIVKVLGSTILTVPPLSCVGCTRVRI
jgi:hypothetical protein